MRSREFVTSVIKAYDVRGLVNDDLTEDFIREIGAAFGALIREKGGTTAAIGYDMRPSSPKLSQVFAEGLNSQGINVVLLGLTSTDQLYFYSGTKDVPGAMFTASHNPAEYNGIKMCWAGAKPLGQSTGLGAIVDMVVTGVPSYDGICGTTTEQDSLAAYGQFLRELVPLADIRPLKVAVDAANGMAGLTVPEVFTGLPIEIEPLYFELDGTFPNHEANPLEPSNLVDLQKFVVDVGADIGLAFDGDADRCFVIDEQGQPVSASAVCAIVAEGYLKTKPGSTIIHNLITSQAVPEIIAENGGKAVRTRVGHSFIKAEMAQHKAVFGGEHSAHYYFQEFFYADSGMLAALYILAALGRQEQPLSAMMAKYNRYAASGEINFKLDSAAAQTERTEAVLAAFVDRALSVDKLDGATVRLAGSKAWFNVRASNTEPLLRLNVEAPTEEEVAELVAEISGIIRG